MRYFQVNDQCNGCLACVQNCPANALRGEDGDTTRVLSHNMARCARCGNCWRICPQEAIEFAKETEAHAWDGFFVWEPVYGIDPWVVLGAIAAQTERIKIGTLLTPPSRRRP